MEMEHHSKFNVEPISGSIIDMLTKNNTSIFRLCGSSKHLLPISYKTQGNKCDVPLDVLSLNLANSTVANNIGHSREMGNSTKNYSSDKNNEKTLSVHRMKRRPNQEKTHRLLNVDRPLDVRRCSHEEVSGGEN